MYLLIEFSMKIMGLFMCPPLPMLDFFCSIGICPSFLSFRYTRPCKINLGYKLLLSAFLILSTSPLINSIHPAMLQLLHLPTQPMWDLWECLLNNNYSNCLLAWLEFIKYFSTSIWFLRALVEKSTRLSDLHIQNC